jgi:hypothetical protein
VAKSTSPAPAKKATLAAAAHEGIQ